MHDQRVDRQRRRREPQRRRAGRRDAPAPAAAGPARRRGRSARCGCVVLISAGRPRRAWLSSPSMSVLPANSSWTPAKCAGWTLAFGHCWSMNGTVLPSVRNGANGLSDVGLSGALSAPTSGIEWSPWRTSPSARAAPSQSMNFLASARCLPCALAPMPGGDAGRDLQVGRAVGRGERERARCRPCPSPRPGTGGNAAMTWIDHRRLAAADHLPASARRSCRSGSC